MGVTPRGVENKRPNCIAICLVWFFRLYDTRVAAAAAAAKTRGSVALTACVSGFPTSPSFRKTSAHPPEIRDFLVLLALCAVYFFPGIAGPKLIALGRSLAVVLPAVGTCFASRPVTSPKISRSAASQAPFGSRAIQ